MRKFILLLIIIFSLSACDTNKEDLNNAIKEDKQAVEETNNNETKEQTENNSTEEDVQLGGEIKNLEDFDQLRDLKSQDTVALIKTNMGDIKIRLFPEVAPKTVENFTTHAKNGYYDNLIFHRVIDGFMIQGGDPLGSGIGGESIWGEPFEDEFAFQARNYRGALSMANAGPHTNGSQFFIVGADVIDENLMKEMENMGEQYGFSKDVIDNYKALGGTPWLDFKHSVFGQVVEGMDVVDKISKVKVGEGDKPLEDVVILSVEISTVE